MAFTPIYLIPGVRQLQAKLNQLTSYVPPPPQEDVGTPRKILMVHAHPDSQNSFSGAIANNVEEAAAEAGHEIRRISLYSSSSSSSSWSKDYSPKLTKQEWELAHETGEDIEKRQLSAEVKDHLRLLKWCDTLIFVYPTWWMNTPAAVKGFMDRALVHGIAWSMPEAREDGSFPPWLVPKLTNISQIVGISTYGAPYPFVTASGDNGRRMIANAVRPMISPQATVAWLGLYAMDSATLQQRNDFLGEVKSLVTNL